MVVVEEMPTTLIRLRHVNRNVLQLESFLIETTEWTEIELPLGWVGCFNITELMIILGREGC